MVESPESIGQRAESSQPRNHKDHTAGKGFTSMTHFNFVHKFIPMPQAMKIPDAKVTVDKEWKKLETIPAWNFGKSQEQKRRLKRQKESPLCHTDGQMSHQECGVGIKITDVQRQSRAPWASQMTAAKVMQKCQIATDKQLMQYTRTLK